MKIPTLEDISGIALWPEDSLGREQDMEMLRVLLELCKTHGFGRVPHAAELIRQVWYENVTPEELREQRDSHLAELERARKVAEKYREQFGD